jgi:hypothetical protein
MNTKPFKTPTQKRKEHQHIPPIAGTLFSVFLVVAIAGAIVGDGRYSDGLIGLWVLG